MHGSCVPIEAPRVFEEFSKGRVPLQVCLEKEHMDKVGFKLATILMASKPKEISVLTIDGSPHCVQLHLAVQQAKNMTKSKVRVTHYIVEHDELVKVSPEAVKTARHLSQIEKLLSKRKS